MLTLLLVLLCWPQSKPACGADLRSAHVTGEGVRGLPWSASEAGERPKDKSVYGWDYYIFSQSWPGSLINSKTNFTNDYFVIHGLWPENNDGTYPTYCNKHAKFNITALDDFRVFLEKYWTDFKNPIKLWEHEYYKHGTCMKIGSLVNTERKYFELGLLLWNMNLYKILGKYDIHPTNKMMYNLTSIINAIEKMIPSTIIVTCDKNSILEEVRICLTKNSHFLNCPKMQMDQECKKKRVWYNKVTNSVAV